MKTITFDEVIYKLVPIAVTDEMSEAAWDSDAADYVGEHHRIHDVTTAYKEMLAAVPANLPGVVEHIRAIDKQTIIDAASGK